MGLDISVRPGQKWGATIQVSHVGAAVRIDAGAFVHLNDHQCLVAAVTGVEVPEHRTLTPVSIQVEGIWDNLGGPNDNDLDCQVCIAPDGALASWAGGGVQSSPKYSKDLGELGVILEKNYADAYKPEDDAYEFSVISATFS